MKLRETYSHSEKRQMLRGNPIAFMNHIFEPTDVFYKNIKSVFSGYFLRSNNKTTSPIFNEYYSTPYYVEILPLALGNIYPDSSIDILPDYNSNLSEPIYINEFNEISTDNDDIEFGVVYFDAYGKVVGQELYDDVIVFSSSNYPNATYLRFSIISRGDSSTLTYSEALRTRYTIVFESNVTYDTKNLGLLIRDTYIDKWNREYEIISSKYDAINDFDITQSTTGTDTKKTTYGKTTETINGTRYLDEYSEDIKETLSFEDRTHKNVQSFADREITDIKEFTEREHKDELEFTNRKDISRRLYDGGKDNSQIDGLQEETSRSEYTTNINTTEDGDYVAGFNSQAFVSTDKNIVSDANIVLKNADNNKDTVKTTGGFSDNKSYDGKETHTITDKGKEQNKQTIKGTETNTLTDAGKEIKDIDKDGSKRADEDFNGTVSNSGDDIDTSIYGKNNSIKGYKNNPTENLQKAISFADLNIFYNIIYKDIDSIITLQIYA